LKNSLAGALLFLPVLLLLPCPVLAQPGRLTGLLERESSILHNLEHSTELLMRTKTELDQTRRDLEQLDYQISEARRRGQALKERTQQRRAYLQRRVRSLYKISRGGFIRLALDTREGQDLFARISASALVLRRDVREISLFNKELKHQTTLERKLEQKRISQMQLEQQLQRSARTLKEANQRFTKTLQQLHYSRRMQASLAVALNQQQKALLQRISDLKRRLTASEGLAADRGKLPPPVSGAVVGRFGRGLDRDQGVEILRHGLTYRTGRNTMVRSVARGVVRMAAPFAGYGKLVLVEHRGGYYTLYGFLAEMRIREGAQVSRGTILGRAGLDPLTGRPAAYFELRQGERPLDPGRWIRRSPQQ